MCLNILPLVTPRRRRLDQRPEPRDLPLERLDLGPPPTAHGVVVACLMADGEGRPVEVARTPLSSRLDPFFAAPRSACLLYTSDAADE